MPITQTIDIICDQCGNTLNVQTPDGEPPLFIGLSTTFPKDGPNVTLCGLQCLSGWTAAQISR
jgi:hypothetical protein